MITEAATVKIRSIDDLAKGDRVVLGDKVWTYNGEKTSDGDFVFEGDCFPHHTRRETRHYSTTELDALLKLRCIQRMVPASVVLSDGITTR